MSDDLTPDQQALEDQWVGEGCPPEAVIGFTELPPDQQASIAKTCRLLYEYLTAKREFEKFAAAWENVPNERMPTPIVQQWLKLQRRIEPTYARFVRAWQEEKGEVDFFDGFINPETVLSDGESK